MPSRIDGLVKQYAKLVKLPWERHLAGEQRIWFAIYDKTDERRLRYQLQEFEAETTLAGHAWREVDLTDAFARWMGDFPYKEAYFADPAEVERLMPEFQDNVVERVRREFAKGDANTVVALKGVACLYGLLMVSDVVKALATNIPGRLLVFFPGEHEGNNYRLLDARDGWNYLAVPITAHDIGVTP